MRYTARPLNPLETTVKQNRSLPVPLLPLVLVGLLTACGSNPYSLPRIETAEPSYEPAPGSSEPAPKPSEPAESPRAPGTESATAANNSLLARAEQASAQGDYDRALAYLERAQRIDPDDAGVYLALARTHAASGNSAQARAVAERGLLYCDQRQLCEALKSYVR